MSAPATLAAYLALINESYVAFGTVLVMCVSIALNSKIGNYFKHFFHTNSSMKKKTL